MINHRGVECCWCPIEVPEYFEEYGAMACLREKGHNGPHEAVMKSAMAMDARDNCEHKQGCAWFKDWYACNCGAFNTCKKVIDGTFIMCGEDGNYCSQECLKKSTDKV